MGQIFLCLLILAQLLTFRVDSVDTQLRVCGFDQVGYVKLSDGFCFLVNERIVDEKELICKYLDLYFGNECLFGDEVCEDFAKKYCDREINGRNVDSIHQQASRKLLNHVSTNKSGYDISSKNDSHGNKTFSPRKVAMAIPVSLVLCCALICPCFRAKKKQPNDQNITSTDILIESVSAISMSSPARKVPGTPRRVPASPHRVPASPHRVPPSPHRVPPSPSRFSGSPQPSAVGSMQLSVNQIVKATENFSDSFKIGEGGFGFIYKAVLPDGRIVSVKRAKKDHFVREEFNNEVELLTKIDHMNLVKLLGYTDKGNERIIITEYVSNGTLREHLDGQHGILDFNQRLQIAIDVAHALTYLHLYAEKPIIHRDVKSSNIMITESYRAKVSDFGFARVGPTEAEQTHILTQVKGTAGYLDPEYLKTFKLTPKSDVFSYGILLIEILSGRRPVELKRSVDTRITVRWAFKNYTDGNVMAILDPLLKEAVDGEIVMKMLSLAFECAAPTRADRPDMREVVEQLWEIRKQYEKRGVRSS